MELAPRGLSKYFAKSLDPEGGGGVGEGAGPPKRSSKLVPAGGGGVEEGEGDANRSVGAA
jgi:hypothetical protein